MAAEKREVSFSKFISVVFVDTLVILPSNRPMEYGRILTLLFFTILSVDRYLCVGLTDQSEILHDGTAMSRACLPPFVDILRGLQM